MDSKISENELYARISDLLKSISSVSYPSGSATKGILKGMPKRNSYLPGEYFFTTIAQSG